ncbi:PR domain zinc finger protein 5-like [Chironomus tepperi]|uniref:PR domain zinc finger protein 5-like n=1 Tax=Chironomus tepperi TaxID=113505 RepID=UPI00391F93B2
MEGCRLCLKNSENLFYIYEYKNKRLISEMIVEIIPELKEVICEFNDQVSCFVCYDCFEVIVKAIELRRFSIDNNKSQRIDKKPILQNIKIEKEESDVEDYDHFHLQNVSVVIERLSDNDDQPFIEHNKSSRRSRSEKRAARRAVQTKQEYSDESMDEEEVYRRETSSRRGIKKEKEKACLYCRKSFISNNLLRYHYDFEHDDKKLQFGCKECNKRFLEEDLFSKHVFLEHQIELNSEEVLDYAMRVKQEKNNYECEICVEKFKTKSKIEHHIVLDHLRDSDVKNKSCSICMETYDDEDSVRKHYEIVHKNEKRTYSCNKCFETFTNEYRLRRHRKDVHGVLPKICNICNAEFSTKREFNLHQYLHCDYLAENRDPVKFECILCSFYTYDQNELYDHLPFHTKDFDQDERLIVCINCNTVVKNFECLHSHTGDHNEYLTHECLKCNKKFAMGSKLLKHLMRHDESTLLRCPHSDCNFSTLEKYSLDIHVKHKHENVVLHLCQICGTSFSERASLKNHITNVHETENKLYKCNLCPMTFRIPSHLRNHQSVHSNEYTFPCDFPGCPKIFKAKRNLLRHKVFHDPTKLNYKYHCSFEGCGKKFLKNDGLKRHMLTHTKIKPHECTFEGCDRAFSQSNDLFKHLRQHYGHDRVHFCKYENCGESFRLKAELRLHEAIHYKA